MADERMKAVVDEDEVEDGGGEVGLQALGENEEEDDELELSLSLAHRGCNVGFTSGGPARNTSAWSEQGSGSSHDPKRSGRVRQLDIGEWEKDCGEMGDSRESLMEMGATLDRDEDAQHKRPKVFFDQQ